MNQEVSAILAIATRDFLKFARDRTRILGTFIFPFIFVGVLGSSLQANLSEGIGFSFLLFTFTGVLGQTLFSSTASGIISLIQDRESDFARLDRRSRRFHLCDQSHGSNALSCRRFAVAQASHDVVPQASEAHCEVQISSSHFVEVREQLQRGVLLALSHRDCRMVKICVRNNRNTIHFSPHKIPE